MKELEPHDWEGCYDDFIDLLDKLFPSFLDIVLSAPERAEAKAAVDHFAEIAPELSAQVISLIVGTAYGAFYDSPLDAVMEPQIRSEIERAAKERAAEFARLLDDWRRLRTTMTYAALRIYAYMDESDRGVCAAQVAAVAEAAFEFIAKKPKAATGLVLGFLAYMRNADAEGLPS